MAYQAPSIWYRDQKGLGSEDWKTGIETQDKTETLRRKNALADAFSKSIVTEIQKDADGKIVARPGDVDQQAFFKHSAASGLGFDEAKAVYDHYDMQKKASLNALKMGAEIKVLGGGATVPSRAGAPIITDTINPQAPAPAPTPTVPKAAEPIPSPLAKELDGKTDYEKVNKLQQWMNSKKADKIRAAQAIVGAKIDGRMGNETKTAFDNWKDRVIKSNLGKDETTGTQNRVDIIASLPKGDEGKLSVGDAFDSQPPKTGTLPREDTRTYLQVIEDRGAQSNYGMGTSDIGYKPGDVKVRDASNFPSTLKDTLKQQGLTPDKLQSALDLRLQRVPAPSIVNEKGEVDALGLMQRLVNYQAKLKEMEDDFYKDLASGNTATVARDIAKGNYGMESTKYGQEQSSVKSFNEKYGTKIAPSQLPKAQEIAAKYEKVKSMRSDLDEVKKWNREHPNASTEEFMARTKNMDNILTNAESISTETGREDFFSDLKRIAPSLGQGISKMKTAKDAVYYIRDNIGSLSRDKILELYSVIQDAAEKNGQAASELRSLPSGAKDGLGKGLKPKTTGGKRKATLADF